jgi:hypothetical protein
LSDKREIRAEDVVETIRWKLGLRREYSGVYKDIWQRLTMASACEDKDRLRRICAFLSDLVTEAVAYRLGIQYPKTSIDKAALGTLWDVLINWVRMDEARRLPQLSQLLFKAVTGQTPPVPGANPPPPPLPMAAPVSPPVATVLPTEVLAALPAEEEAIPTVEPVAEEPAPVDPPTRPPAAGSGWVYREVPKEEPDRHPDAGKDSRVVSDGYRLIGARVRGKKHKHEATNCDDWFEAMQAGPWTIIAVSDGAGSRRLSRFGAKVSCERAVHFLADALSGAELADEWPSRSALLARKPERNDYLAQGLVFARNCLHEAFAEAYKDVARHAEALRDSKDYKRLLGRPVTVDDLSATLLIALHRTLKIDNIRQSLVLSCQIGDGAIAIVDRQAHVHLLGHADSGDFSGETDFLTSRRQLEPANLQQRTSVQTALLRALFVMTDGVADDYFPADPGLARLYADLVLNGVLPPISDAAAPQSDILPKDIDPTGGRFDSEVQLATADGTASVRLRLASLYAAALNCKPHELAASADLLRAGARDTPLGKLPSADDRLLRWLDAYQVRGSFDDRTLVVLHCEKDS